MLRRKVKGVDYASIHERYQDTALVIFKRQQQEREKTAGKRASRKRSVKFSGGRESIKSNLGEHSNESAYPNGAVITQERILKDDGIDGEMSSIMDEESLESHRMGVQSKVCSVL